MTERNGMLFEHNLPKADEEIRDGVGHTDMVLRQLIKAVENLDGRLQDIEKEVESE